MNRRILKFAALLAALCLALTGCNLIGVDPLMQLAEDRAAVDDIRETVLAEYDGGTVTVSDIIYDFNLQWSYYYQLYSMYGMELDGDTLRSLRNDCVDMAVQRAAQAVEAGRRGIALSDEEMAECEAGAQEAYDYAYESILSQLTDEDEDVRTARAGYELYATGQDYDAVLRYDTSTALANKLRGQVDTEVTEPTEEEIGQIYNERVESDEASYSLNDGSFETAMANGTLTTWMPEGYRTVKHILVIPDEAVLTAYQDKKNELDSLESELTSLNEELLAAEDDDPAEGEEAVDTEALQAQIAEQEAAGAAAQEELVPLKEACFADVQDTLDEIQARIDAGEDFQALIDEYGEDPGMQDEPTATVGYYVSADSTVWDTAFRDAAMLLANVGDISEPVLGMSGIHIIRYEGDVTPGAVPLEEVRGQLFDEALATAQEEHYAELLETWVAAIEPVYHYDNWDPLA